MQASDDYEVTYNEATNSLYVRLRKGVVIKQDSDTEARVHLDIGEGARVLGIQVFLDGGDAQQSDAVS